jgi:outer membrane protein OmpA-like peptidoglycan-associated protein
VKQRLTEKGIPPDSVKVFGFGKSRPLTNDTSESGRARNRRVEFMITGRH